MRSPPSCRPQALNPRTLTLELTEHLLVSNIAVTGSALTALDGVSTPDAEALARAVVTARVDVRATSTSTTWNFPGGALRAQLA
jgi:hypothetical protein